MYFINKTLVVLLVVGALAALPMGNVFQAYAAQGGNAPQNKSPTLTIFVNVINDEGGTKQAMDFPVSVNGKNAAPSIFSGSETGTKVTLSNGTYKVTQLSTKGYDASYSPGCEGRIHTGESVTCVITNDDIPAHLNIVTEVINDDEGSLAASDFTTYVYGNNPNPSYFQGSETGVDVKLGPGYYQVNQDYNPDYYTTLSPECYGMIDSGEEKTCTITNDDIPKGHLIVTKQVINDDGGTLAASDFYVYIYGNNPNPSSFQGSESGTEVTINEGYYEIYEYYTDGYNQSFEGECSGYISGGETRYCTITNDDMAPGHLIVTTEVINDNTGTLSASDFNISVYGNNPTPSYFSGSESGVDVTIWSGYYDVYQDYMPGYTQYESGDCHIYLGPGETRYCTITNDDE